MKKLMTIFGAFFLASVVLTSCGDVNIEDLDKDIKKEEDAVKSLLKLGEAQMELMEACKAPMEELAKLKDRAEEIQEAMGDLIEVIQEEKLAFDDITKDDDMDEMDDEIDDLQDELKDLKEDMDVVMQNIRN